MGQRDKPNITYDRLREMMSYDPQTGIWIRLKSKRMDKVGVEAGWVIRKTGKAYVKVTVDNKHYSSHILAYLYMTGFWPESEIDHKDGEGTNNRWSNLRPCSRKQNCANSKRGRNNTSGYKGVSRDRRDGKWRAAIWVDGRQKSLGYFANALDAAYAYRKAAKETRKEFARW